MSQLLEAYKDLVVQIAIEPIRPNETDEQAKVRERKMWRTLRRGLVIAAGLGVQRLTHYHWEVHSTSSTQYGITLGINRWNCGCEYYGVAPRFLFEAYGTGRLCKHIVAAILSLTNASPTTRPTSILEAFERIVQAQIPTLMRYENKELKEWRLYKRARFNIDTAGCVRVRIIKGRSSKALAQVRPAQFWGGSGPAPYECKLLPDYKERYQEWLDEQTKQELITDAPTKSEQPKNPLLPTSYHFW